jgi:hypothetical protein
MKPIAIRVVAVLLAALAVALPAHGGQQSDRELSRLMVGAWRSPRHDYVYLADGTWWMGKPDPKGPEPRMTHGRWRIENHTLVITTYLGGELPPPWKEDCYPIQKLTQTEIVYAGVYRMKRIGLEHVDEERPGCEPCARQRRD